MKTYEERMASVQQKLRRKQTKRRALIATAGALSICLVVGIFISYFQMDGTIRKYSDSEYFKVINAIDRDLPKYRGNTIWDRLFGNSGIANGGTLGGDGYYGVSEDSVMEAPGDTSVEITDHQVAGVYEGDLIKRSKTHIFYLKKDRLEVYPIEGEQTYLVEKWQLDVNLYGYSYYHYFSKEMHLSEDASRLVIIGYGDATYMDKNNAEAFVRITLLDVSDPENIKELKNLYFSGTMKSSRIVGEQMLLMMQYSMNYEIDYDDITTFIPHMGSLENMVPIPADSITVPEKLKSRTYTLVALLDKNTMELTDIEALMAPSNDVYVSKENIYSIYRYNETVDVGEPLTVSQAMTDITCLSYGKDGLKYSGTFSVVGTVKNQYSMDEYNGILRVVTSTNYSYRRRQNTSQNAMQDILGTTAPENTLPTSGSIRNASLTCYEVGSWKQVAQVKSFAPDGETAESVRFDGNYAYVCTAVVVQLTDPVFFFDLTDLNDIKIKDTGTIDGYSSSLVQLKDGYLLGIGLDNQWNLKVEIYVETETGVTSVCEYTKPAAFSMDYKSYYIDRENNLFGIPTYSGYILLSFDGGDLQEVTVAEMDGDAGRTRGVVIDNCLYVFSPNKFSVQRLGSGQEDGTTSDELDTETNGLIPKGKVIASSVNCLTDGTSYSFVGEDVQMLADYFSGLNLIAEFEDDPKEYDGKSWLISLLYEEDYVVYLRHCGNQFVKCDDGQWYKMEPNEADRFETIVQVLVNEKNKM